MIVSNWIRTRICESYQAEIVPSTRLWFRSTSSWLSPFLLTDANRPRKTLVDRDKLFRTLTCERILDFKGFFEPKWTEKNFEKQWKNGKKLAPKRKAARSNRARDVTGKPKIPWKIKVFGFSYFQEMREGESLSPSLYWNLRHFGVKWRR